MTRKGRGFAVSDADYAEIWAGLGNAEQEYEHLFARMLLSPPCRRESSATSNGLPQ